MIQSLVTVIVAFPFCHENDVRKALIAWSDFGQINNKRAKLARNKCKRVHFMSMVVAPALDEETIAHLVIEASADGQPQQVVEHLASFVPDALRGVLGAAGFQVSPDALVAFLEEHRQEFGLGWFRTPGLVFAGTPGMSVERILDEDRLAIEIRRLLDDDRAPGGALEWLDKLRGRIFADPEYKWAFVSEPVPLLANARPVSTSSLARAAFEDFLWPLAPPPVLAFLYSRLIGCNELGIAVWHSILCLGIELLLAGLVAFIGYRILLRAEKEDVPLDIEPIDSHMKEIAELENRTGYLQNHLAGVSIIKPGWFRHVALRLALWVIGELGVHRSRPGFIDQIGTIHFARWVSLPGTNRLVFLSNYDGGWQSYLEDFIARLRKGLTSVWSNTRDFPKTFRLTEGGAGDGARFKRWARRQQVPTRFWYSAYPHLTTGRIRTNAAIRHGFAGASTEHEAAQWLALFGYAARETLEYREIQALAFSGLAALRCAHCLIVKFNDSDGARRWVQSIERDITYGEAAARVRALAVAFTSCGLRKLGLDDRSIATFPIAFQQGMASQGRLRALGDDPTDWDWGNENKDVPNDGKQASGSEVDALLMLYAATRCELDAQINLRKNEVDDYHCSTIREIALTDLPEDRDSLKEPFGFRDGISQPVIRGTIKWSKKDRDWMHAVEPGELVLGYRDNMGNLAPSPECHGTELGRNGTYLVVRQLEQDVDGFNKFVSNTAQKFADDIRMPKGSPAEREHWIAAKMVGRWKDGSSLVQHPDAPPGLPVSDNSFLYGREDPDGMRCPLGAHIRRANPRDSFEPESQLQMSITNRHRILRVGRGYRPGCNGRPGLLFMCINADIERQFEFLQQSWILGSNFDNLDNEIDPIVGYRHDNEKMTIPTPEGPLRLSGLAKFVKVLGGGYFFMPGKTAIHFIARGG